MAAAAAFVRASKPDDELFLMNFADKAGLEVPFTSDRSLLESGIARVDAVGGTALRDAIAKAEAYLSSGASRERKALLLVSDGNDNARGTSRDVIVQQAEHGDIAIYALGLQAEGDSARARRGRDALDDLSERTGGSAHFPSGADDIEPVAAAIARQIRSEYTLGYTPVDQALDGSYRKLRVVVKGGEHLSVRTRAGYRATADAGSKTQK
jgi:VWFA-related protein